MRITVAVLAVLLGSSAALAQDGKVAERSAMNRLKGVENAPLTVYEIADFQCPYCGRFARDVAPKIDSAYIKTGKVKWIFINFPLPMHQFAWAASEAAMCAGGAGKFWPMHDKLFDHQAEWSVAADPRVLFSRYAKEIGLTAAAYDSCTASDATATLIVRDILNASSAGPTGTPAFIVGSEPLFAGYKAFEEWKEILDNALKKASEKPSK